MLANGEQLYAEDNNDIFTQFGMTIGNFHTTLSKLKLIPTSNNVTYLHCQYIHFLNAQPVISDPARLAIVGKLVCICFL